MKISHIVAMSKNNVIGFNNDIPWRIPGEQKRFRELTLGNTVIMGRKTYLSLDKKLDNRRIIILSKRLANNSNEYIVANTIEDAFKLCENEEEVYIAGGGEIYNLTLPLADSLYITVIDKDFEGSVYYPNFNKNNYIKTFEQHVNASIPYTYFTYQKKSETSVK
jgi:dihydrofolate reductase